MPMTTVSLLTPLNPARTEWLTELVDDVDTLRSEVSAQIEWIICLDGEAPVPIPPGTSTTVRLPLRGGPAAARTAALAASSGQWSLPIDADDRLHVPGTVDLLTELDALTAEGIGWVGASRTLLDGTPTVHTVTKRQHWAPGTLAEHWTAPFPFHPNTIVVQRSTALACGGWPALPTNEDLAFVLAISEAAPGRTVDHVVTRYRTWDDQMVNDTGYPESKQVAFTTIAALHSARRAQLGRTPITAPTSPGGAFGRVGLEDGTSG